MACKQLDLVCNILADDPARYFQIEKTHHTHAVVFVDGISVSLRKGLLAPSFSSEGRQFFRYCPELAVSFNWTVTIQRPRSSDGGTFKVSAPTEGAARNAAVGKYATQRQLSYPEAYKRLQGFTYKVIRND